MCYCTFSYFCSLYFFFYFSFFFFFFFNDTATTEIYTLSLHDALPIFLSDGQVSRMKHVELVSELMASILSQGLLNKKDRKSTRLNSSHSQISYAVFCLKKKKKKKKKIIYIQIKQKTTKVLI